MSDRKATLKEAKEFFEMSIGEFRDEWTKGGLTIEDKDQILTGIGNGSLTY